MKTPSTLMDAFGPDFEEELADFLVKSQLIPDERALNSSRFLSRSVAPHILRLSSTFNRLGEEKDRGIPNYWKKSSNPKNLRMAYFLFFMPLNLFRVASVWSELRSLGLEWNSNTLSAIEFGSGPATGACGIAASDLIPNPILPKQGTWSLIERDRPILEIGASWSSSFFRKRGYENWKTRTFCREVRFDTPLLPKKAPSFNLWLFSYVLNEPLISPESIAKKLVESWESHLEQDGIVIIVEPALKDQSRKLLELRKEILAERERRKFYDLKVLTPCLGHQRCGALEKEGDWCHERASWWRPPYLKTMDKLLELDHKKLDFSYLVLARTKKEREDFLPLLNRQFKTVTLEGGDLKSPYYRLVSDVKKKGKSREFYVCGENGKHRIHARQKEMDELKRGTLIKPTPSF